MRRPENLKLKYFLEKMTLCDVWKLFSMCFFEVGDLKVQLSWSLKGVNMETTLFRRCEVLIINCLFVLKDQVKKVPPFCGGIELCGGSSCLGSLRSLLNTVGILTLPMFLLSDGSLLWMWSASLLDSVGVAFSVYYCKIFKFCFWMFFWRCGGFWWHWWFDFYGLKLFLSRTCGFHLCIQLCTCWMSISSGRLYQFYVHLELDLLDACFFTWSFNTKDN